jgi:hypothetical protein
MELETEPLVIDEDLTNVATTIPSLPDGVYDLRITSITKEQNKDRTGHNGVVTFETTAPAVAVDSRPIAPGHKLRMYMPLQNKPDAKEGYDWRQRLAQLQEAALGAKQPRFDANELIGRVVRARVKYTPESADFGAKNDIASLSQVK